MQPRSSTLIWLSNSMKLVTPTDNFTMSCFPSVQICLPLGPSTTITLRCLLYIFFYTKNYLGIWIKPPTGGNDREAGKQVSVLQPGHQMLFACLCLCVAHVRLFMDPAVTSRHVNLKWMLMTDHMWYFLLTSSLCVEMVFTDSVFCSVFFLSLFSFALNSAVISLSIILESKSITRKL